MVGVAQHENRHRKRSSDPDVEPESRSQDAGENEQKSHSSHHIATHLMGAGPYRFAAQGPGRPDPEEEVRLESGEQVADNHEQRPDSDRSDTAHLDWPAECGAEDADVEEAQDCDNRHDEHVVIAAEFLDVGAPWIEPGK